MKVRALLPVFLMASCGAPPGGVPYTPTPTPPQLEVTPSAEPATPTVEPATPSPTPTPWTDAKMIAAVLSGPAVDAWISFYDEAVQITEEVLAAQVAAGNMSPVEAAAAQVALEQIYKEVFTEDWLNQNISELLKGGTIEVMQRLTPAESGNGFTMDYFVFNLGNTLDEAYVGTLVGSGQTAGPGTLQMGFTIPTGTGDIEVILSMVDTYLKLDSDLGGALDSLLPWNNIESAMLALVESLLISLEVPENEQQAYIDDAEAALQDAEHLYATDTTSNSEAAIPLTVTYDVEVFRYQGN